MLKVFQSNYTVFYDLFEQAASNNVKAAKLLHELCIEFKNPGKSAEKIHKLEHIGDEISHKVFFEINKSFMTPIDREDIIALTHALDDVIDCIYASASDFDTYQVKKSTQYAKDISKIIVASTEILHRTLPKLRKRKLFHEVEKAIVEVNRLENEADVLLKDGLKSLFKNPKNPVDIIRLKAIYTNMEQATDACEQIANVLEGLTIKYA